jgi:YidC/Oxa1 family membrane protein insertase
MDKNQAIGLALIAGLLIIYSVAFRPPADEAKTIADTVQVEDASTSIGTTMAPQERPSDEMEDTTTLDLSSEYGVFATMLQGEEQRFTIDTDVAKYVVNTKGGVIEEVELKDYKTYDGRPLLLTSKENSQQDLLIQTVKGNLNVSDFYFDGRVADKQLTGEETYVLSLSSKAADGGSIQYTYTFNANSYEVGFNAKVDGLSNSILGESANIKWAKNMSRFESNLDDARNNTTMTYYTLSEDYEELSATSKDPESETVNEGVKWASFNQKFFNAGLIAENGFQTVSLSTAVPVNDTTTVKSGLAEFSIPMTDLYAGTDLTYFYGPKQYKTLKSVGYDYEENVYMGYALVSWFNKYILVELFAFLEGKIANYGIIIMIIVLIVKMVLFPLTRKSYLSMAKMKVLKPELDELKEKYGDDPQKMQQEQMALYRQFGANPIQGCLPMVLQMPILFAMFFFFPNSIELRQESFLWAHDLSTYDVLINLPFTIPFYGSHVSGFTLLMTLSTLVYTWSNNQVSTVQGPMKNIGYIMPVMFMFILNSYSSGLSFYYFVSNVVTFSQQALIRKFVDDDKIRATLMENKKKNANKKKSKFQQRLEEAMKASQEAQKQKQKQKKRK